MKIICIGEALIDMICTDAGRSLASGEHFLKKPGGAPTNVAAAIAALGGEVALAAKVGADPFGQQLVQVMREFGVQTDAMYQDPACFTTLAFVSLLKDGERDFVFNRGADGELSVAEVESLSLADCSIVHFGSATAFLPGPLQAAYTTLLQKAKTAGRLVSFDPNYRHLLYRGQTESFTKQAWAFLLQSHFFKLSDEEALLLTGAAAVAEAADILRQKTAATFCITLGKQGTLLVHGGQQLVVPSVAVVAIDSTGAGDAFVGAVLYQLRNFTLPEFEALSLQQWQTVVANANKAGARTCQYHGAMEAFKHLSQTIFD